MSNFASFVGGLADGINSYIGKQQQAQREVDIYRAEKAIDAQYADKGGSDDPILTPNMAETVLPGHGGSLVNDYNQKNPDRPLKLSQGVAYLKQAADALAGPDTSKLDKQQDTLENQAMTRMTQIRGDQSLQRAERQRDAAAMAYDTIAKAQSENRDLTQLEQSDLIGQLWQARSGKAPTDQDMKEMQDRTAKRGFNHIVTYLTGNPNLIGASTTETLANLKQFVDATGKKADEQHEGYWNSRIVKPTGLEQARWDHISKIQRGISYADQKATSDKTYPQKKASASSGWSYVGPVK